MATLSLSLSNPSPLYWIDSTAFTQLTLYARATVYINTDSGEKVVTCPQQALSTYGILPLSSYPDSRAKKMIVQFQSGSTFYTRTFNLKPHPYLNLAYSLEQLKPVTFRQTSIRSLISLLTRRTTRRYPPIN